MKIPPFFLEEGRGERATKNGDETMMKKKKIKSFVTVLSFTVLRSKGFIWLATRHEKYGTWLHAGREFRVVSKGGC